MERNGVERRGEESHTLRLSGFHTHLCERKEWRGMDWRGWERKGEERKGEERKGYLYLNN